MLVKNDIVKDILTNNLDDKDSAKPKVKQMIFRWPRHSTTIEQLKGKAADLNIQMKDSLKELELYQEEPTTKHMEGRVSTAARLCSRNLKRKVWIRFDIFMARGRPGLEVEGMEEEKEQKKKKKKKRNRKSKSGKKKNDKAEENKESFTSLITVECGSCVARAM